MSECEALCNRIGILRKGQLIYIGDFDQLRENYIGVFTLVLEAPKCGKKRITFTRELIMFQEDMEEVKGHIEDAFPTAILKVEYPARLNYLISLHEIKWSKLFALVENLKCRNMLSEYYVLETNLEQIFVYYNAVCEQIEKKDIAIYLQERMKTLK